MSDIGEVLRATRESKKLTIREVSEATRIKPSFLEALEHGEYALLPGPAYVTGFLRNYAAFLGIHPDDVVQQYHTLRPAPPPTVKPATRVLASSQDRQFRSRLLWALSAVALLLMGGFAIKQYNDTYAHTTTPQVNLTPANLGATTQQTSPPHRVAAGPIHLHLRSSAPVWVKVRVDGRLAFQGILRPQIRHLHWTAHHTIYVATLDGSHIRATYDGRSVGRLAKHPGLVVDTATPTGWQHAL